MVDETHNNESHHGKHPFNRQRHAARLRSQRADPRIVHLGFGAFHRAHQAVYADILASEHGSDWGYTEVNLIGGEQQIADLRQQDRAVHCGRNVRDAWTARVVRVVKQALHAQVDGLEAVLAAMCEPQVAIVSLTITEERLLSFAGQRRAAARSPADRRRSAQPAPAKIGAGRGGGGSGSPSGGRLAGFTVMSCETCRKTVT